MTDARPPVKPADVAPSAREVARYVDRRQVRRKIILLLLLVATIILAVVYLTCGRGWGLGGAGKGNGDGSGPGSVKAIAELADAGPSQCELRLSPEGLVLAGQKTTREAAIAACKTAGRAVVTVTGNTVQADWDELKAALEAAKVEVFRRESSTGSAAP